MGGAVDETAWRVDRELEIVDVANSVGVRLLLELAPLLPWRAYGDFRYFAPPALYDLNDLNDDGVRTISTRRAFISARTGSLT